MLRDNKPQQFISEYIKIFADTNSYDTNTRQSAGTLIVSTLKMKLHLPNVKFYWDLLSVDLKNIVKNAALQLLMSPENVIMKTAANIVAVIACI